MNSTPPPSEGEMSLIEHLLELRSRLLKIVLAVCAILLILLPFSNELFAVLSKPLMALMPAGAQMVAIDVASPFFIPLRLTLVAAVFIAMPVVLYHLWAFVAPGLYSHEKELIFPLLIASTALFYIGVLFAYYVVFPLVFGFMISTTPQGVAMMTDIGRYLDFVLTVAFAFGVAFQVPILTIVLVWMEVVTPESLTEKRPYIIVLAFIIGMILTPPDVISQTLLAVPMWLLFEAGLVFARLVLKKKQRLARIAEQEHALPSDYRPLTPEEMDAQLNLEHDDKPKS